MPHLTNEAFLLLSVTLLAAEMALFCTITWRMQKLRELERRVKARIRVRQKNSWYDFEAKRLYYKLSNQTKETKEEKACA